MVEKRSIWWKIYFYVFLVFSLVLIIAIFTVDGIYDNYYKSEIIYEVFQIVLYIISFLGLYGFIYIKKIFYKDFWIFILTISIIDNIGSLFLDSQVKETLWVLIIFIPFYIALYKYSFNMNELWSKNG